MRSIFLTIAALLALVSPAFSQFTPPISVCSSDQVTCIYQITKLEFPPGSVTQDGKTARIAIDGGGAVSSVFGRTGVVTAQPGDYLFSQIGGTITNSMVDAAAAIALSKLAITGTPDGTKFIRGDGTWAVPPGGGGITPPFSVTDSLNDINPNYTSYLFNVEYNGTAGAPGTLVNLGLASRLTYGNLLAATGTQHNITTTADIIGSASGGNEFAALMGWMRFSAPGRAWFTDWSLHGRIGSQQQLLNGVTMLVNNYYNGSPTNGPSAAIIAVSAEGKGAGGEGGWTTAQTYPVDVGFAAVGHSGVGGGSTTGRGFNIGFLAGSNASGWMVPTESSWIGVGFQAQDFDFAGYVLGQPRGASRSGILVAPFDGGGVNNYGHIIDFTSITADDIATGGSVMYLPAIGSSKLGILFGGGTRLFTGGGNIARIDGRMGIGGDMTTVGALLEVVGSASISDPLFAAGSPGATDANSFKFYNGSGDITTFIAGGASQFVIGTAQGDGGLRAPTTKNLVFGDSAAYRMILTSAGPVLLAPVAFASLGTPANGALTYCSNCLKGSNPCSGASTGSMAARLNGVWRCD